MASGSAIAAAGTQMAAPAASSGAQAGRQAAKADGGFQKLLDSKAQAEPGSRETSTGRAKEVKAQDGEDTQVQDAKDTPAEKPADAKDEAGAKEGESLAEGSLEQAQLQAALLFQLEPEARAAVQEMPETMLAETAAVPTEAFAKAVPAAEIPVEAVSEGKAAVEEALPAAEAKPVEELLPAEEVTAEDEPEAVKAAKEAAPERTEGSTPQQEASAAAGVQAAHGEVQQGRESAAEARIPTARVPVQEPEEIPQKVLDQMLAKTAEGIREFEIQLEPEELGKILIKVAFGKEAAHVSIVCTEPRTMELMARNARDIGAILSDNLGSPTTIVVEDKEPGYLEQHNQGNGQGNAEQEQEQQQERQQRDKKNESLDFLQQLRLGLV